MNTTAIHPPSSTSPPAATEAAVGGWTTRDDSVERSATAVPDGAFMYRGRLHHPPAITDEVGDQPEEKRMDEFAASFFGNNQSHRRGRINRRVITPAVQRARYIQTHKEMIQQLHKAYQPQHKPKTIPPPTQPMTPTTILQQQVIQQRHPLEAAVEVIQTAHDRIDQLNPRFETSQANSTSPIQSTKHRPASAAARPTSASVKRTADSPTRTLQSVSHATAYGNLGVTTEIGVTPSTHSSVIASPAVSSASAPTTARPLSATSTIRRHKPPSRPMKRPQTAHTAIRPTPEVEPTPSVNLITQPSLVQHLAPKVSATPPISQPSPPTLPQSARSPHAPTVPPLSSSRGSSPIRTGRSVGGQPFGQLRSTLSVGKLSLPLDLIHGSATTRRCTSSRTPTGFNSSSTSRATSRPTTRPTSPSQPFGLGRAPLDFSADHSGFISRTASCTTSRSNLTSTVGGFTARTHVSLPSTTIHSAADPFVIELHRNSKLGNIEAVQRLLWRRELMLTRLKAIDHEHDGDTVLTTPHHDPSDLRDRNGSTPLFHAGWSGDFTLARLLLSQSDCKVNQCNVRTNTPLDMAIERSNTKVVSLLLAHGAKLSKDSIDAAEEAFKMELLKERATYELDPQLMQSLRDRLSCTPHKALKLAQMVKENALGKIHEVLRTNSASTYKWIKQFMERGLTLLGWAAWHGHTEMVRLLLHHGASIDAPCFIMPDGCMLQADEEDQDDDDDSSERVDAPQTSLQPRETNAFGIAVERGHYQLALMLLDQGASPRFAVTLLSFEDESASLPSSRRDSGSNLASALPSQVRDHVTDQLQMLVRLQAASLGLRQCLVEISESGLDDCQPLALLLKQLSHHAPPTMSSTIIQFPDEFNRCSIHVAISLQLPICLDYLLSICCPLPTRPDVDDATYPVLETRENLRHKLPLELGLETNHLQIIMQLLRLTRPSLRTIIRAMDRTLHPHTHLNEQNGLLALQFTFERLRAINRQRRARIFKQYQIDAFVAKSRGETLDLPPSYYEQVISLDDLIHMLNMREIDADLAQKIIRALMPGLTLERTECGLSEPPPLDAILSRLHAIARARGETIGANGSSGYGRAESGLSARGISARAKSRRERLKKNRLHDPEYLASLLEKQRRHNALEYDKWRQAMEALARANPSNLNEQDRLLLQRMKDALLTERHKESLIAVFNKLKQYGKHEVEFPLSNEAELQLKKAQSKFNTIDMTSDEAKRHQQSLQPNQSSTTTIDWDKFLKKDVSLKATAHDLEAQQREIPFEMKELIEFNPRLLTALQSSAQPRSTTPGPSAINFDRVNSTSSSLSRSSSSSSTFNIVTAASLPPTKPSLLHSTRASPPSSLPTPLVASHTLDSWLRCWQDQAMDEGIHSINVFLREAKRRGDSHIKRRDWLPLLFLWPNRFSQEQAIRAAIKRNDRLAAILKQAQKEAPSSQVTTPAVGDASPASISPRRSNSPPRRPMPPLSDSDDEDDYRYEDSNDILLEDKLKQMNQFHPTQPSVTEQAPSTISNNISTVPVPPPTFQPSLIVDARALKRAERQASLKTKLK